jgi:type II secretory pathway pseudopilin PulG
MLIVVAIIAIMAAVALPAIGQYIRNYKIQGAEQQLVGELQAARSRAIMSNTNAGVSFVVVDFNSYRFVQEDLPAAEQRSPLRDLPDGVRFILSANAAATSSVRFNRLGGFCVPGVGTCAAEVPFASACTSAEEPLRCTTDKDGNFFEPDGASAGYVRVTLVEMSTQVRRVVRLAPGGRIQAGGQS